MTCDKPAPIIQKITFSEQNQYYISSLLARKPAPNVIIYWTDKGMNVEQRKKWYASPQLKERMRTIQRKYNIGLCHICQELPHYKLIFKMDGVNLVEYWCEKHKIQIPK